MHCDIQEDVVPKMGAHDRLPVRMVAEMLTVEVLFKVAATRESLQAIGSRQMFVAEAKYTLGGFTFDWEGGRKVRW